MLQPKLREPDINQPSTELTDEAADRQQILDLVAAYHQRHHQPKSFVPGQTRLNYAGRIYDADEMTRLAGAALDFWLTAGPNAAAFENRMRKYFKSRRFLLVNSGSSANLLMIATLCSEKLDEKLAGTTPGRLLPGDEVITPAVTFPTTLAPILQNGLVPVFIDCEVETCNINPNLIEAAIGPRTKALFIPHTVGNPCHMDKLSVLAKRHNLWLLEDGCDALGARYDGRLCGTFGALSSLSFYPAHHMTMGEGGGVVINDHRLIRTALSLRDWGRDCWCEPGKNNTCGKRFDQQCGTLPFGYDHKYIYSTIGYNLKSGDLQAAIGLAQAEKIPHFIAARQRNFAHYLARLQEIADRIILPRVEAKAEPSPFGFPITVRDGIDRRRLIQHLEAANIETRLVFGGNILRQPGYRNIPCRIHGELTASDIIADRTLFVGVYPGLSLDMIDYIADQIITFCRSV